MARRKRNYTVRTGDTAATIARQLGVDPQTLMQANTGVSNLRPGMVIRQPPTPPKAPPAGTGGMYWGQGVYDAVQGAVQNAGNLWDQTAQWGQNAWQGAQNMFAGSPPPPTDLRYRYGGVAPAAQPTNWFQNAGQSIGALGDRLRDPGLWPALHPQAPQGETFVPPTGLDYRNRSASLPYDTPPPVGGKAEPSQYQYYGNLPGGMTPSEARAAGVGRTFENRGGIFGASRTGYRQPITGMTPTEAAAAGATAGAGNYVTQDELQTINRGYGTEGRTNMAKLAALGRASYGGIVDVQAKDGSFYKMKVRDRGGGDVRYTPVSGATQRSMARSSYGGGRKAYRRWRGDDVVSDKEDKWRRGDDDAQSTSGAPVGSAPRYQPGSNFDYDTRGGYMPMTRQRARPGYLGLINWRI